MVEKKTIMNFKEILFSKNILKTLFVVFIFLLLFISAITYKNTLQVSNSSNWVMHSYKVQKELDNLLIIIEEAEAGQRGYLLTHDLIYLEPYLSSKQKIRSSLHKLVKLSSDNPAQQKNILKLSDLVEKRYGYLRYSIYQDSLGPNNKNNLRNSLDKGRMIMDTITMHSDAMLKLEEAYLTDRNVEYKDNLSVTPLLILVITLFSLFIFIVAYIKINKDLSFLEGSNKQLNIANESNKQAQKIGEFCTWTWNLQNNSFSCSDSLFHLLGSDINSFEPTIKNISQFIHPEDQPKITSEIDKVLSGKPEDLIQHFRIIRKDGKLRYFKSLAKTVLHDKGERTVIGVISDITEQHETNMALERRNFELEQTNTELASFNHVASHDLQEPLRKIQLFISRISAADLNAISEAGKEYISKIQLATTRMRTLIDDLLLFSRTNKADKDFVSADLNELLDNAKQELIVRIQEKKATIHADNLPELNVIPYQIQQLFINLINNSLKYSKPDVNPIISIRCEEILGSQISFLKTNPEKKYYKISVSDNGMGFDPQFSESIFTLFQRLHSPTEFPGTGIGLAICKKIVENHMGVIKAEGKLGIGAIFTFFLPIDI